MKSDSIINIPKFQRNRVSYTCGLISEEQHIWYSHLWLFSRIAPRQPLGWRFLVPPVKSKYLKILSLCVQYSLRIRRIVSLDTLRENGYSISQWGPKHASNTQTFYRVVGEEFCHLIKISANIYAQVEFLQYGSQELFVCKFRSRLTFVSNLSKKLF